MSSSLQLLRDFCGLAALALFSSALIFAGCSINEKETRLPPLVHAARQLAKAERIKSDPPEKVAEILSVARTVAKEIRKPIGEGDMETPVRIYNRAAVDLAGELPKLNQYRRSPGPLTLQNSP